jgi:sugar phosphate isomerase/epimerase
MHGVAPPAAPYDLVVFPSIAQRRELSMDLQYSTAALAHLPISRSFTFARELGLTGIEVALTPLLYNRGPARLCRFAAQTGVLVRSLDLSALGDMALDPTLIAGFAAFAAALPECRVVVLPTPRTASSLNEYLTTLQRYTEELGDHAAVTIVNASGNAAEKGPLAHFPQLRRIVEEWELGYTFDTTHAASNGWVITEPLPQMGVRLRNVHFSDFRQPTASGTGTPPPLLPGPPRDAQLRRAPGEGVLPLRAFLRALQRRDYDGLLTLDLREVGLRAWWPPALYQRLGAAVTFCRETLVSYEPPRGEHPHPPHQTPAEAENEGRAS